MLAFISPLYSGLVDVGDQLIATSAVVYNSTQTYGEARVGNWGEEEGGSPALPSLPRH